MTRTGFSRGVILAVTALLTVSVATACTSNDGPKATDRPVVVASTDVWASVANAVGGEHADVSALYNSPDGDPHEFEPSSADTARVHDANVIVMNGDHYDAFMETAAEGAAGSKVIAYDARSNKDRGNEHVFYDLAAVADTATAIAEQLATVAPVNANYYRTQAAQFIGKISTLQGELATLKSSHAGTKVAATEPLAATLLDDAGVVDVAPPGFQEAVEQGQSPSAADLAKFDDLLTQNQAKALIYNTQAIDSSTQSVLDTAKTAKVSVVQFTESLPAGVTDYIVWQQAQITALGKALNS